MNVKINGVNLAKDVMQIEIPISIHMIMKFSNYCINNFLVLEQT